MTRLYLLILILIAATSLCSCASSQSLKPKDAQSQALDSLNEPSSEVVKTIVCDGKVLVVFDEIDMGSDINYLNDSGFWVTYKKGDCKK
jgi:hypothetical protein